MKIAFFLCCLTFCTFAAVRGQTVADAISKVILPCATESGMTASDLDAIQDGDLSSVTNLFGCFSDCASQKSGVLTDGVFQADAFEKQLSSFISAEHTKDLMERCSGKAGTENCKVTGPIYQCFLGAVVAYIYS